MITNVVCTGFKSLSGFSLDIKPGLNILVGPNGSGKTNIISLFKFISNVVRYPISEAIGHSGGAGYIFRKIGAERYCDEITVEIYGHSVNAEHPFSTRLLENFYYCYKFKIKYDKGIDHVYFKNEFIGAIALDREIEDITSFDKWSFKLEISSQDGIEFENDIQIKEPAKNKQDKSISARQLLHILFEEDYSPDSSVLLGFPWRIWQLSVVKRDLLGGNILNISPVAVKMPEDGASPPGIREDGSGVAATLYYLQQASASARFNQKRKRQRGPFAREDSIRYTPDSYDEVQRLVRLVNDSIDKIRVENQRFDNRLSILVDIPTDEGTCTLPFSAMSDGTIKWTALVCAILTYRSLFAIEEPENFLHPLLQREVLDIVREDSRSRKTKTFALMSTHSETLLNAADPSEVIAVSMDGGRTVAKRPESADQLRDLINDTGFGLGHFYVTGVLS